MEKLKNGNLDQLDEAWQDVPCENQVCDVTTATQTTVFLLVNPS